jgi:hypothetical protein
MTVLIPKIGWRLDCLLVDAHSCTKADSYNYMVAKGSHEADLFPDSLGIQLVICLDT